MTCVLLMIVLATAMPVLAVEIDLWRFRFLKRAGLGLPTSSILRPKHSFTSALILMVLLSGWAVAVNGFAISRSWGMAVFTAAGLLWAPYVNYRTRRMWLP